MLALLLWARWCKPLVTRRINNHPSKENNLDILQVCDLFSPHVIKPFLYLHCAYCTTANRPFFHVGTLLSLRENPFSNCCRPPLRSTLIILQAQRGGAGGRMQDEDLQPAQGAAPPVASISHQAPPYRWSREVVLLAGPATWLRTRRHDYAARLVNGIIERGQVWC